MDYNDILRRIRYTFDFSDSNMIAIFEQAESNVTREQLSNWLKKEENPDHVEISAPELAAFLNGLIIEKRGRKDGPLPEPEKRLNNNIVFRKLKIALNLQAQDVLDILELAGLRVGKHELSAFFRAPKHKHYRVCQDQILRNFLSGLQLKYRDGIKLKEGFKWK